MSDRLLPELRLAAACCRWPLTADAEEAIRAAASRRVDWSLFETIVFRNRIVPLVNRALTQACVELPEPFARRLSDRAYAAARRALVMAREAVRLQRAFEGAGLPAMIIKGHPLAMLAYGELGLKESADIDLLVSPETAARAIGLLIELGYDGDLAKVPGGRLDDYLAHAREAEFSRVKPGVTAELHWRLCHNRRLLRGMSATSPSQEVAIPGGRLRTLADEELFAYLCVHGGTHNWSRLKWLADVSALLGGRSALEIANLYEAAQAYDAGRPAAVALLLCRELFALPLDEALLRMIERDRIARALVRNVFAGLTYRKGATEHDSYTLPWLRRLVAQFFLARGFAHRIEQLHAIWDNPPDRTHVYLPKRLDFAYHLIRVPLWLGRVGRRLFAGSST